MALSAAKQIARGRVGADALPMRKSTYHSLPDFSNDASQQYFSITATTDMAAEMSSLNRGHFRKKGSARNSG